MATLRQLLSAGWRPEEVAVQLTALWAALRERTDRAFSEPIFATTLVLLLRSEVRLARAFGSSPRRLGPFELADVVEAPRRKRKRATDPGPFRGHDPTSFLRAALDVPAPVPKSKRGFS